MRIKITLLLFTICLGYQVSFSQKSTTSYKWWNPAQNSFHVIEGQAWPKQVAHSYDRLPASAEQAVRKDVWNLSLQSAGLMIRFRSNSTDIRVRYTVSGRLGFPHMPSTGVSGIDLYAVSKDGAWEWAGGKYSFGDTVEYHFQNLKNDYVREYRLYLPLYNSVKWLEIGVPDNQTMTSLPVRDDKPIVVYGTSIAQGACASRPGMAWTAIMGRQLDRPVINLAFSGNGRLEKPLIDLIAKLDAKIFVLDCFPNLGGFPADTVRERLLYAVKTLQKEKPKIPILIVEDANANTASLNASRQDRSIKVNEVARSTFAEMKAQGIQHIYYLSAKEIGFGNESTVEGTHPNDVGMEQYATSYTQCIRKILNEPEGPYSTMQPCIQYRDGGYDWDARHRELLKMNKENPPSIVFLGNSITHYWGGLPKAFLSRGADSWKTYLDPAGVRNFGYGWDRIENVLWRVYHGELDGYQAKQVMIMIGTNNIGFNTDEEIIAGLRLLVQAIKVRQPSAGILLMGIFPRRGQEGRIVILNEQIVQLAGDENITYANPGVHLLNASGKIEESYFTDGLHPNEKGYGFIGKALKPYLAGKEGKK